jgi:DNA-binding GntR family transcriptional regulator
MTSSKLKPLTTLQKKVVREITALVRREGMPAGEHLPEIWLAETIGTSRSPIQAALRFLHKQKLVAQDQNRGFFLAKDAKDWIELASLFNEEPDDPLYLKIAEARQKGNLESEVSEAKLMRMFSVSRGAVRKTLARISEEGWAEPHVSQGWRFQELIDNPESYDESYLFRKMIEPAGIMSDSFHIDLDELNQLRAEQENIVNGGYKTMTPIELFQSNSRFHETLAKWSNNRFILQSVKRVNLLRRLVEYHQASTHRRPRQTQANEHLEILDALSRNNLVRAAALMQAHLDGARKGKAIKSNKKH